MSKSEYLSERPFISLRESLAKVGSKRGVLSARDEKRFERGLAATSQQVRALDEQIMELGVRDAMREMFPFLK
jgi:hypothetical protein